MLNMTRRAAFGALMVTGLAGCSLQPSPNGGNTVVVNLANAQAEAVSIFDAVSTFATTMLPSLPYAIQADVRAALAALQSAINSFVAVQAGQDFKTYAAEVVKAIGGAIALLPLGNTTLLAISAGVLLINSLIAGIGTIVVPPMPPAPMAMPSLMRPMLYSLAPHKALPAAPIPVPVG